MANYKIDELSEERDILDGDVDRISDAILLNATTSVKIADAKVDNEARRTTVISNPSNVGVFVKEQAASVDDDKKGIYLPAKSRLTLYDTGTVYNGEMSAIAEFNNPDIYVVEH